MKRRGKAKIKHIVSDEELQEMINERMSDIFVKLSKSDIKEFIKHNSGKILENYDDTIQN